MKDDFLATLSHELRTPLNAIVGWAQIIRANPGDPADVTEGIEIIDRNARAQTRIIEDLLDMSRIISGKVRLPLTIGVFGNWGGGKTSIMKMLQQDLSLDEWQAGSEERKAYEHVAVL